ncbi:MAG: methylated-DNA--[protein]-cysteine S-methyltransferase [Candidatus Ornithospirochaeta sp.]|mgnify:FL=1
MKISFVSLLGPITIFEEGGKIVSLLFSYSEHSDSSPLLEKAKEEIEEYFQGKRKTFDLPLDAKGTEFQKRVWKELLDIRYGETLSYGEIGDRIGTKAYRAIGNACGKNPIPILIPCHRVVGKDNIGGFSLGLDLKRKLLDIERS